jgi:hypothetical protein
MRVFPLAPPRLTLLVAGLHFAVVTTPSIALAQAPQPVPYATAPAPVPYGAPAPTPGAAAVSPGRAAPAGGDVIYMKNGGILRGTIVDAIPGAQARIQLATGEIATVPWPDINRIEHAETPRPSAPPPPGTGNAAGPTAAPSTRATSAAADAMVWVRLDGSDDARLEQDTTGSGDWRIVCQAPCDRQLSNAKDYRITGGGMKNSAVFNLRGQQGDHETVTVSSASKAWFVVGIVLVPVGGLVTLVGLMVGLVGSLVSTAATSPSDRVSGDNMAHAGWITAGIGVAALVGGIVLIVSNARTSAAQDVASAQTGLLLQSDAWKRMPMPTWKDASSTEKSLPSIVSVPVLNGRF